MLRGGIGADTLTGGAGADVFLFRSDDSGRDRIRSFDTSDVLVSTTQLSDSNRDGIITFGNDKVMSLGADASVSITGTNGGAVSALEYDGAYTDDGATYYVYSLKGPRQGSRRRRTTISPVSESPFENAL